MTLTPEMGPDCHTDLAVIRIGPMRQDDVTPARWSPWVGGDGFACAGAGPCDGEVGVHGGCPEAEVFALVVGSAEGDEVEQHGPATGVGVGVVELDQVVEFGVLGRLAAFGVAAYSV